ncbi:uncharacterized protein LOC132304805 [Cornus florida]|uniref:uncharacterized protein LOC132304805 n=1 Tax=Cornus florida TaxID=4283 RepID=UPI002898FCE3|nr:uncharacterized protein LOC132304805 [Cornus florida]
MRNTVTTNSHEEDEKQHQKNTVTTNSQEEDKKNCDDEEEEDDEKAEESEEEKINTNSENENAEDENDESESEAGGQKQDGEDGEDDEDEDVFVSDKVEDVGNSLLPIDKRSLVVQKSNLTSSEEDFYSESESKSDCRSSKPLPKPIVKCPAKKSEQNEIPEPQRKKRNVNNGCQAIEEKKSAFSRFWIEEDEIAILKGMVE